MSVYKCISALLCVCVSECMSVSPCVSAMSRHAGHVMPVVSCHVSLSVGTDLARHGGSGNGVGGAGTAAGEPPSQSQSARRTGEPGGSGGALAVGGVGVGH